MPAFSTVTIYVAVAPGYSKLTSNVADRLSPDTTAAVFEVAPVSVPSAIFDIFMSQFADMFAVPFIVNSCYSAA